MAQTCPACSAQNSDGVDKCEYCGSQLQVQQVAATDPAPANDITAHAEASRSVAQTASGGEKSFKCESCGAVVHYSAGNQALSCDFCGSNYVVDVPARPDRTRPSRIVPFAVEKQKGMELFRSWLGKGFWRPGDLKAKARADKLNGVYLPFWAFDVEANSSWTASAGYYYYVNEQTTDSQGKQVTKKVRKTRWEPADGRHHKKYHDWLVSASGGLDQEWVHKIEPFDLGTAKAYSTDYMAGWAAEEYSVEPDYASQVAEKEINENQKDECAKMVPGDTQKDLRVSTSFRDWARELLVLPIYISSYQYKDKVYRFLVNGQTGEVVGKAPISKVKVAVAIILGLAVAAGIAVGVALSK